MDNIQSLRNAIAQLDAKELHQAVAEIAVVMESLDDRNVVFREGDQQHFENVSMCLCDALSQFAVQVEEFTEKEALAIEEAFQNRNKAKIPAKTLPAKNPNDPDGLWPLEIPLPPDENWPYVPVIK